MLWSIGTLRACCLLLNLAHANQMLASVAGRDFVTEVQHLHVELDNHDHFHAQQHLHGQAALEWLSDDDQVIPHPAFPADQWPQKLVIGYADGYDFEILKPLIYGFLGHVKDPAWLVLLTSSGDIPGLPRSLSSRIVVQKHGMPEHLSPESLPYPVSLRIYITASFLRMIKHDGFIFFLDTRDVFIQRDPFAAFSDGVLHFPRESASYRIKGPYTNNSLWLLKCYGKETMTAIGGNYVLNSGTLIGPSWAIVKYFELMAREFEHRWHCIRLHGSDQAVHNYLVSTGKLIGTGLEFQIEDQITSTFAFIAYTHPNIYDFRYVNERREELFNREGNPMVAIHLWPGENRVAKKVVLPFVSEFEQQLKLNIDKADPPVQSPVNMA